MHEEIHARALAAAASHRRAEAELIEALIAVDAARVFAKLGFASLFVYATQALQLSESVAYNAITVARKSREVPALRDEIARGTLSISKARKIAPVLNAAKPELWLERARTLTSRELEREVARENPKLATQEKATYISGSRLTLSLGVEEALLLKLKRAQDQVSRSRGKTTSLEETLAELVGFYLQRKDPLEKAHRAIARRVSPPVPGRVPAPTPTPQLSRAPERSPIPVALRHEVRLRDQNRCQSPGCTETRWVDLHHLQPIAQGGRHEAPNLITLCRAHHRHAHSASLPGASPEFPAFLRSGQG